MLQDWTIYSWYCPNCKTEVCGIKDKKDQIKTKCERCGVYMVRKSIGRRHLQIDIYASDYDESMRIQNVYLFQVVHSSKQMNQRHHDGKAEMKQTA